MGLPIANRPRPLWAMLWAVSSFWASISAAEPLLEKTDLFEAGRDGYALYRIPGIVVTSKGTLLAYCEARKSAAGDWGPIDLMLRRSPDGGKTWEPQRQVVAVTGPVEPNPVAVRQNLKKPGEITLNNPVAIVDGKTGAVHFLYCVEYARCYYLRSDDDGKTFSKPVDITAAFEKLRPEYDWKVLATGPAHGIQLKSGRLVVPIWLSTGEGGHAHRPSRVSVITSDDHGQSWQPGELVPAHQEFVNPNETAVVELTDGRVMLNIRSESKAHRRALSYSADGATKWTAAVFHSDLLEPICMASTVRFSGPPAPSRILFANPDTLDATKEPAVPGKSRSRKQVTIKLSLDEGLSWPVSRLLEDGPSGYSDLAVGPDGIGYCFYERGRVSDNDYRTKSLCVARFNLEWLSK